MTHHTDGDGTFPRKKNSVLYHYIRIIISLCCPVNNPTAMWTCAMWIPKSRFDCSNAPSDRSSSFCHLHRSAPQHWSNTASLKRHSLPPPGFKLSLNSNVRAHLFATGGAAQCVHWQTSRCSSCCTLLHQSHLIFLLLIQFQDILLKAKYALRSEPTFNNLKQPR